MKVFLLFTGFLISQIAFGQHIELSSKYQKSINKELLKVLEVKKEINLIQLSDNSETTDPTKKFYSVHIENNPMGYLCLSTSKGRMDYFDYFVFTDTKYKVIKIKGLAYRSDHGGQVFTKSWLKQFIGMDSSSAPEFNKDIDGISGATISGRSITQDIHTILQEFPTFQ